MAIYHMSVKIISRSSGRTSVGAAAYRSGEKITNERDGLTHDYTHKTGVVYSEVMLCENAPKEWQDRGKLWNAVEQVEKSNKAQVSREIEIALPKELSREEQVKLTHEYVKENFVDKGMCADINIHDKNDGNPHAHIMLTMRSVNENGEWEAKQKKIYELDEEGNKIYDKKKKTYKCTTQKTNDWDNQDNVEKWRENWARACNDTFKEKGMETRIDHRSYKDQGIKNTPTIHLGSTANAMEKRKVKTDRGNINREIKLTNEQIQKVTRDINDTILERAKLSRKIKEQEQEVGQTDSFKEQVFTSKMTPLEQEEAAREMIKCEDTYALLEESKSMSVEELDRAKESYEDTSKEYNKLQQHLSIIKEYRKSYKKLEEEREGLGVFKFAQKKELDRKMAEIDEYKNREYDEIEKETDGKIKGYKQLKERLQDQENKLNRTKDEISNLEDRLNKIQREQKQLGQKYCHLEEKFNKANVSSKEVMSKLRQQSKEQQHKADVKEQIQVIKTIQQEKKAPTKHKVKNIDRDR